MASRSSRIRTVDASKALYDLVQSDDVTREYRGFQFQRKYLAEQSTDILLHLDVLIRNTRDRSPCRSEGYRLARRCDTRTVPRIEEVRWERAMWNRWGPCGQREFYLPGCPHLQTYQFPLKKSGDDSRWGKVDLLGVSTDHAPVVNELKRPGSEESVLRMLIEMVAYSIAVQEVWPKLRPHWNSAMQQRFGGNVDAPHTLSRPLMIGVAPQQFWDRQLAGIPVQAWPAFFELVDALSAYFTVTFAVVEATTADAAVLPMVHSAHDYDLRRAVRLLHEL